MPGDRSSVNDRLQRRNEHPASSRLEGAALDTPLRVPRCPKGTHAIHTPSHCPTALGLFRDPSQYKASTPTPVPGSVDIRTTAVNTATDGREFTQ